MSSGAFLLGLLNEVTTVNVKEQLSAGFPPWSCFSAVQSSLPGSSPLNLLLFHEMRLFSKTKQYALPSFSSSYHNQISMQDDGRILLSIKKKKAKARLVCCHISVQCLIVIRC